MGDIYVSFRRNALDDLAWETPQPVTELNSSADEFGPTMFRDPRNGSLVIFFNSNRPGLGGYDIYTATQQADGKFSTPTLVPELSSTGNDTFPMVRPEGLELILTSNRSGGLGGNDLWVSTRATISEPWSTPVNFGPTINTSANDNRGSTYAGGTRLAFFSNRSGNADLYESTRTRTTAIPAVGSVTGAFGTTFKTTGQISNPSASSISGNLVFHPAGSTPSSSDPMIAYTLNAFETRTFADLMSTFGTSGLGWLEIVPTTGAAPAPSFVIQDGGTVAVPTVDDANVLVAGSRAVLVTPADVTRFRFNIGVRTLSNGATISVSTYDTTGTLVRTAASRTFPPNYFNQFSAADLLGGAVAANQTAVITVNSGSAVVYASSVANSGTGSTLQIVQRLDQ